MPGWPSGYGAGLENPFPHGFPGSNPGPGVFFTENKNLFN